MISKDQPIEDLIQKYPDLVGFLISHNLPCVVCGDPFWGTLEELAKSKGFTDEQITQALAIYREYYHDVGMFENEVFDGIPELLQQLNDDGITLATATSKPDFSATRIIKHFGLRDHFTFIGAANLEGTRDSKALVIEHTLDQLKASARTHRILMVGDRHHDVHGAKEHGIDTIGVLWGYGDAEELTEAGAIALVQDPQALHAELLQT